MLIQLWNKLDMVIKTSMTTHQNVIKLLLAIDCQVYSFPSTINSVLKGQTTFGITIMNMKT